jgi:hypothetical protein
LELRTSTAEKLPARHTLEYLGHKQPSTPTNRQHNSTWCGKQQRYEKIEGNGHAIPLWLRCRINQCQFRHYWTAGKSNNGDFVTKHPASIHHQATRPTFLTPITILHKLQSPNSTPHSKGVLDILVSSILPFSMGSNM